MDAVAGLEWVKRNAAAFGGDPNNVTLGGQSAGGMMVSTLLSVPSAKGLFHKAVVESGAGIGPAGTLEAAEKKGAEIATKLGFDGAKATAKQLRSVSAQTLVYNPDSTGVHGAPNDGKFRTQGTGEAFAKGTDNDVPVLVGSNAGEGGFNGARAMAKAAGEKGAGAWLYQFAYTPSFRTTEWKSGPIHSGEIMFAFNSIDTSSWATAAGGSANDADKAVGKLVNSCWVAFYKMDPKAKSFTCANGFNWPAYTDADDSAAQFGATPKLVKSKTLPNGPAAN
jgi:para-nitrobenzyl esterase